MNLLIFAIIVAAFVSYIAGVMVTGVAARSRGWNPLTWMLVALVATPLITLLGIACTPIEVEEVQEEKRAS